MAAWKWSAIAFLYFVVFLGRSGGGLGPSSMCGEMSTLFVLGTVASVLAAGALLLRAILVAVVGRIGRPIVPRMTDVPSSFNLDIPESGTTGEVTLATPRRRLTPFLLLLALFGFAAVIRAPSGCTAFNICANAERPVAAEETIPLLRFSGDLPQEAEKGPRDDRLTAYTAVFDATAPWQVTWGTSGDRVRLDVFASDAVQSGNYFPDKGHVKVVLAGSEGSERLSESGRFCVRIELRDEQFENRQSAYYGPDFSRRTGPPPTPRQMSWTVTIGPP